MGNVDAVEGRTALGTRACREAAVWRACVPGALGQEQRSPNGITGAGCCCANMRGAGGSGSDESLWEGGGREGFLHFLSYLTVLSLGNYAAS